MMTTGSPAWRQTPRPAARRWCWRRGLLWVLAAGLGMSAPGARAGSPFDTRERLCQPLGPLAEQAMAEVVEKAAPLQRELLDRHMKVLLDDMQVVFGLAAKERAGLELDAASMVTLAVKQWKECALEGLRPLVPREGGDEDMAAWMAAHRRASDLVPYHGVRRWTPPEQLPHWARALEKRLGAQRATQWLQVREEQRRKLLPAIGAFVQRWAAECRQTLDKMRDERLQLLREAGLSPTEVEDLTTRLRQLTDNHVAAEMDAMRDMLGTVPDQSLEEVLSLYAQVSHFVMPSEKDMEAAWRGLLADQAGAAGLKKWEEMMDRKTTARDRRIAALLEPSLRLGRMNMEAAVEDRVDGIAAMLDLDPERSRKLEALGARAVNEGLEAARLDWTKRLINIEKAGTPLDENPEAYLPGHEHHPLARRLWQDGLRTLLSEAEMRETEKDEAQFYHGALTCALARAAVVEMDHLLALDAGQRVELQKVLEAELADVPPGNAWQFVPSDLLLRARSASREALGRILDEAQLAQFPTAAEMPPPRRAGPQVQPRHMMTESEQQLAAVTLSLHTKIVAEREKLLHLMLVRVADARRVLHLTPQQTARLTTAAKGVVEAAMASLRESVTHLGMAEFANAAQDKLQQVLDEVRTPWPLARDRPAGGTVWQQALDEMLTPAQRAAWQKVIDERTAYRVAALTDLAVAELARRYRLKSLQREKIRALMAVALAPHVGELDRVAASGRWGAWHLQCNSCTVPLAAVPRDELRAVLTLRQWNQLHEQDMPTAKAFWKEVQNAGRQPDPAALRNAPPEPPLLLLDP